MNSELPVMQLLVTIADRTKAAQSMNFFKKRSVSLTLSFWGRGTASNEIMDILGISEKNKVVVLSVIPREWAPALITQISDEMQLRNAGRGIVFTVPLSAVSQGVPARYQQAVSERKNEERVMYSPSEKTYELIIAGTEEGLADAVMNAARTAGAQGGTVLKGRGASDENTESFFGLKLYDELEILAIVVERPQKLAVMNAVGAALGEKSPDKGFVFSVPVSDVVGVGAATKSSS